MRSKLTKARNRWQLANLICIDERTYKAVYSAVSPEYGPVIVKLDTDKKQLRSEYAMLNKLKGNGCCRVYAYDEEEGILLEEKLLPGTVLREEVSLTRRLAAFHDIFYKIHQPMDITRGESYMDWLEYIHSFCIKNHVADDLTQKAMVAKEVCAEIFKKYTDRFLLHGDLHHDNILLKADGTYGMIDPKGVIGPAILDLPRYIMNEIDTKYTKTSEEHIREVICEVSRLFHYPEEDIKKLYFMEVVLGNLWCVEDGEEINREEMTLATKIFEEV